MLISQQAAVTRVECPAKLNLFLEVLNRREDGYHNLDTLMLAVNLFDTLILRRSRNGGTELRIDFVRDPYDPAPRPTLSTGSDNLVLKAANLLTSKVGQALPTEIGLTKRIPMAAGLGGGSSDAAGTLLGLNSLWGLNLSTAELLSIGAQVGSDVPFFLSNTASAICRGRGELVEPLQLPTKLHAVVVKPIDGLSTAEVFRKCVPAVSPQSSSRLAQALQRGTWAFENAGFFNRLSEPARWLCPALARLETEFEKLPTRNHLMTGSGTSYFGMFANRRQAAAIAAFLRGRNLGSIFVVQSC